MVSTPVRLAQIARLEDLGEERIFDDFIEFGFVKDVLKKHEIGTGEQGGKRAFYRWLKSDPQRWARWQETKELAAEAIAERGIDTALNTTPQTANADKLKYEASLKHAEFLDRTTYGKQARVAVSVGTPEMWLAAINGAEETEIVIDAAEDESPR